MKNLIFVFDGVEYVDSGVYENVLREEAKKQGVKIDRYELNMLLDELEANGRAEDYKNITADGILNKYLNFIA